MYVSYIDEKNIRYHVQLFEDWDDEEGYYCAQVKGLGFMQGLDGSFLRVRIRLLYNGASRLEILFWGFLLRIITAPILVDLLVLSRGCGCIGLGFPVGGRQDMGVSQNWGYLIWGSL